MQNLTKAIIDSLKTHHIKTHGELASILKSKGIHTTQATISRQMQTLGARKQHGIYTLEPPAPPTHNILRIQASEHGQIILHTPPGFASSIARTIDQTLIEPSSSQHLPHLLASLSGDDTILLIAQHQKFVPSIIETLHALFAIERQPLNTHKPLKP